MKPKPEWRFCTPQLPQVEPYRAFWLLELQKWMVSEDMKAGDGYVVEYDIVSDGDKDIHSGGLIHGSGWLFLPHFAY